MIESVSAAIEQEIPGTLLFDYPTIEAISGYILAQLDASQSPASSDTDDDLEAQLLRELEGL